MGAAAARRVWAAAAVVAVPGVVGVAGYRGLEAGMIWRSAEYRLHVTRYVCPVCGGESECAAHVGGISGKGTGVRAADWVCCGMCSHDHDRLDGRQLPPLGQRERARVLKACIVELGE